VRVLLTGCDGYIGAVMAPFLRAAGHDVVGLDSFYFAGCDFGGEPEPLPALRRDVRDVRADDLRGFDAVIHLAALSNDPLGDLNPACTWAINHRASVALAGLAKAARVPRFLYASSCSVYGAASPEDVIDESGAFRPVTPYAESKVRVEAEVAPLADDRFSPTFLRNATVYGVSRRLRGDLVVNNLAGWAVARGRVLLKSDGTPWRPLVHVEDVCRAFRAVLEAPRERVHARAWNVGREGENYRIRDVAECVRAAVAGSTIEYAEGAGPDPRCYRVDFSAIRKALPGFEPEWTVARGVEELVAAFRRERLTAEQLEGRYLRIRSIRALLERGDLDAELRWQAPQGARSEA
jgi:nucleoside-diphosphate-sugar epimerase